MYIFYQSSDPQLGWGRRESILTIAVAFRDAALFTLTILTQAAKARASHELDTGSRKQIRFLH